MPPQNNGALIFFPHFTSDDPRISRMVAKYKHEGYYFCYRMKEIICATPEGQLVLAGQQDREYIAYLMRLDVDRLMELIDSATACGWFDRQKWIQHFNLTSEDIQKQIGYVRKTQVKDERTKEQKRLWWNKNRAKISQIGTA